MYTDQRGDIQTSYREWLEPVKWDVFATLRFTHANVKPEEAAAHFHEMHNRMERDRRTSIGYACALERRARDTDGLVAYHIHAVFAGLHRPVSPQLVAGMWGEKLAKAGPYDPRKDGLPYIFKEATDPDCWAEVYDRIDKFIPGSLRPMRPRDVRRWASAGTRRTA